MKWGRMTDLERSTRSASPCRTRTRVLELTQKYSNHVNVDPDDVSSSSIHLVRFIPDGRTSW